MTRSGNPGREGKDGQAEADRDREQGVGAVHGGSIRLMAPV
jgi:hypothetical protein